MQPWYSSDETHWILDFSSCKLFHGVNLWRKTNSSRLSRFVVSFVIDGLIPSPFLT